ncbi:MAG TPA: hypothetical protein VHC70_09000 [Phycisphaerales bacterium]|nr:hypothetical protein [Phycisphaerales bacterium]
MSPSPRHPSTHRPPRHHALFAAACALACITAAAPVASAQVNYTEPPDLSGNLNFPTPVGTVSLGLNTIHGTISTTYSNGFPSDDDSDSASFTVPAGLVVTSVVVVITNYTNVGDVFTRTKSFDGALQNWWTFGGNGTGPNMITTGNGVLAAGTYGLGLENAVDINASGSISYTWEFRITAAPATNDTCQLATPIGLGATAFNNIGATTDGPATMNCGFSVDANGIGQDLWYRYVPGLSGVVTASTCGASFDTALAAYVGPCDAETQIACNDDNSACGGDGLQSLLTFTAAAGTPYLIRVGGYANNSGTGTLILSAVTTGACCNRWTGDCTVRGQLDCTSQGLRFDGFGAACSPTTCKACPADFDGSGDLAVADIFAMLNAWFAGCP